MRDCSRRIYNQTVQSVIDFRPKLRYGPVVVAKRVLVPVLVSYSACVGGVWHVTYRLVLVVSLANIITFHVSYPRKRIDDNPESRRHP